MRLRTVTAGVAGGVVGGAFIGALEAVVAWTHAHGAGEVPAVAWALVVYGLVGGGFGLGLGIAALVLGTDGFALGLAGTAATLGFVVGRFRIVRDVLLEQVPRGVVPVLVQVGALAATVVAAALVWRWLRGAQQRVRWLANPLGAAALVGGLAALWAGGVALRASPPAPSPVPRVSAPAGAPDVVLIVVDTLRADHLGCYGYAAARTPHIDALAARGTRYASTFAQASWTRPSFATIFTSLYPSSHGAVHKADRLPDRVDTVAEVLARAGYYTVGFADNANISPAFNFDKGFAEYHYLAPALFFYADESAAELTLYSGLRLVHERFLARAMDVHHYYQPAETVTAAVEHWLDSEAAHRRPFFLFVHYMDPHDPYFVHPFDGVGYARVANPNPTPGVAETYRRLYDGEIAYLDEHLGALLDDIQRRGLFDDSLIVLTGDHGEEFHEHGGWWHGTTLYDEQTHVPLIVKPPRGGAQGRVVNELTTSLDIAPTILAAAHVPVPPAMQGRALPLDDSALAARDHVFSETDLEGNVVRAVRTPAWKFITANPGNPRGLKPEELYDLTRDPGEHTDLATSEPVERETLRAALGRSLLEARAHAGAVQQTDVDAVTQERLRALGYVN
jgi:arylsulfatase A-like enzyme